MAKKVCDQVCELSERDYLRSETYYRVPTIYVTNTRSLQSSPGKRVCKGTTDAMLPP